MLSLEWPIFKASMKFVLLKLGTIWLNLKFQGVVRDEAGKWWSSWPSGGPNLVNWCLVQHLKFGFWAFLVWTQPRWLVQAQRLRHNCSLIAERSQGESVFLSKKLWIRQIEKIRAKSGYQGEDLPHCSGRITKKELVTKKLIEEKWPFQNSRRSTPVPIKNVFGR